MKENKHITPLQAIRQKCLDCVWGDSKEVKLCPAETCPLFPFRFGKNSFDKRTYTEEQRTAMANRMKNLNKSRKDVVDNGGNHA